MILLSACIHDHLPAEASDDFLRQGRDPGESLVLPLTRFAQERRNPSLNSAALILTESIPRLSQIIAK
jgi:hypothetical protein